MRALLLPATILMFLLAGCKKISEPEIIIIPRSFKGYVIVAYDQALGAPTKYEGSKRVYEIPQSGILKTQFKINAEWKKFPEYYYERIAPENRLLSFAEINRVPISEVVGFMGASGTVKKEHNGEGRIEFSEFYIGTKSDIEQAQEQVRKLDIVKLLK